MCDVKLARGTPSRSPHVVDFIKAAMSQLPNLKDVNLLQNEGHVTSDVVMTTKEKVDDEECDDLTADIEMVSMEDSEEGGEKRKSAIKLSKTGKPSAQAVMALCYVA